MQKKILLDFVLFTDIPLPGYVNKKLAHRNLLLRIQCFVYYWWLAQDTTMAHYVFLEQKVDPEIK